MVLLMVEHHMQDHLVVGWIPIMPVCLPSGILKVNFDRSEIKIITDRDPGSLKIRTSALIPPTWEKNFNRSSINRFQLLCLKILLAQILWISCS